MSEKFSIINTLDLSKIQTKSGEYRYKTGEKNPYIFMSKETIAAIEKEYCYDNTDNIMTIYGYKVFVDNSLKFGEVEIR